MVSFEKTVSKRSIEGEKTSRNQPTSPPGSRFVQKSFKTTLLDPGLVGRFRRPVCERRFVAVEGRVDVAGELDMDGSDVSFWRL
jgi:hypothetical protein